MNLDEFASLIRLADPFCEHYATAPEKEIRPKQAFTADRFTRTLLTLVSFTNGEGYDHALTEVFGDDEPPHRASFSKARAQVAWTFFRDQLLRLARGVDAQRTTFGGLKIFAVDGHQLVLPYTKDIYAASFSGRPLEDGRETYMLRAYMSHCYDVLSGVTADVTFEPLLDEHRDRRTMLASIPNGSLVLYDRNYFSQDLAAAHAARQRVYFLARVRRTASREIEAFFGDEAKMRASTERYGRRLYFFKVLHPKTRETSVYVTDLPESWHRVELLERLYWMRWETETEQRDITETVRLEQWHSTTLNGILQEFYATLWLVNVVRLAMLAAGAKCVSPLDEVYGKPNFKLCFNFVARRLSTWLSAPGALIVKLSRIVRRSTERRRRYGRSYPREVKRPQSPYEHKNTVASYARPPPPR
jgi:hypothetical protein